MLSGAFLVVPWLGLCTFTAGGAGSIPGLGTKILHASLHAPPPHPQSQKPFPELNADICDSDIICFQIHISQSHVAHTQSSGIYFFV